MLIPSEPFPENPNTDMARVLTYWNEAKAHVEPASLPGLRHIELMDLHDIATHLLVGDVVREPPSHTRYRWRFWGTRLTDLFGIELSGRFIDEAYAPAAAAEVKGAYDWIIETRRPHYWTRRADNRDHLVFERLICPLLGDSGETIDHLFGIITFVDGGPSRRFSPTRVGERLSFTEVTPD